MGVVYEKTRYRDRCVECGVVIKTTIVHAAGHPPQHREPPKRCCNCVAQIHRERVRLMEEAKGVPN